MTPILLDVDQENVKPKVDTRTLRRLLGNMAKERRLLACALLAVAIGTAATLSSPRILGYTIDEAILPKNSELLTYFVLAFFLAETIRVVALIIQSYLFEKLGQRVMQDLRVSLFAHLQSLPIAVFDRNPAGRLVTRVTNDIAAMAEMFSSGVVTVIGNFLVVVGILVWLMVLDLELGLIAAAIFPVLVTLAVHFSKKLNVAYRNARGRLSALNAFLAENISGMRVVHLFGREKEHLRKFNEVNRSYADAQFSSVRIFALFQPSITWCVGISVALVIWFGGSRALEGELRVGVLVAFFTYVLSLFQPVREIADKWNLFLSGATAAERVYELLDWKPELERETLSSPPARLEGVRGHIVFENVWFSYDQNVDGGSDETDSRWVLRDLSLEILPGMKVGVVGHTGAGKTTLISLLMRFYEPQRGRILLDGVDLREYDRRSLRDAIGIVQQDVFLFSGSLRDNIALWREPSPEADAAVRGLLQSVALDEWLEKEADALQERGTNLSMGERQVTAFARALSTEPAIWILDEATANIDSRSEGLLGEALARGASGRTQIYIAHRLATVRSADVILVLNKGVLVEKGSHQELLRTDGLYARLFRYQTAMDVENAQLAGPVPGGGVISE